MAEQNVGPYYELGNDYVWRSPGRPDIGTPSAAHGVLTRARSQFAGGVTTPVGTPTTGLAWKMSDTIVGNTKKAFAHYFGPYRISEDNALWTNDVYHNTWNNPHGSYASTGGAFRDRPYAPTSPPHPLAGDYTLQDCTQDVVMARAAGLDGFFFDMLGLSGANFDAYQKLAQAASTQFPDGSFKVIPMVDANGGTAAGTPDQAADAIAYYAWSNQAAGIRRPSAWFLDDGRYVVSCFKAEGKTTDWWTQLFNSLFTRYSLQIAFIGVFVNINSAASYAAVDTYGESDWGYGADPNIISHAGNYCAPAHSRGKVWMAPVVPQDVRPFTGGLFDEAIGFSCLIAGWTKAIGEGADYVQVVTWCDFSETPMTVSAANGWSNLDVNAYYMEWWKKGVAPTILRDAVFLAHRNQFVGAPLSSGQSNRMSHWSRGNMSATQDIVQALTFLTAPAQVTVTIGGVDNVYTAPAGVNIQNFPLVAGTKPAAAVRRNGDVTTQVTSNIMVTATPVNDDMGYYRCSSIRGTANQFQP